MEHNLPVNRNEQKIRTMEYDLRKRAEIVKLAQEVSKSLKAQPLIDYFEQSQENRPRETIVPGTRYTERDFLRRAVIYAIPRGSQDGVPIEECRRWVAVRDAFGCGSDYAHALCREFDLAPGKIIKK